jgi:hypothetical protein
MELLDTLAEKVQKASRQLIELKKERQQMTSELEILRQQLRNHQSVIRENDRMRREHDQLRNRLLRLQKKIEKHLLVETTLAASASEGGNTNEEYS